MPKPDIKKHKHRTEKIIFYFKVVYEIKKIRIWPFARSIAVILTAAMVIVPLGVVFFVAVMEGMSYGGGFDIEDFFEIILDEDFLTGYFIVIPVSAAISLAASSLGALVYNFVAERIGGIVLNIDYHQEEVANSQVSDQGGTEKNS